MDNKKKNEMGEGYSARAAELDALQNGPFNGYLLTGEGGIRTAVAVSADLPELEEKPTVVRDASGKETTFRAVKRDAAGKEITYRVWRFPCVNCKALIEMPKRDIDVKFSATAKSILTPTNTSVKTFDATHDN